MCVCSVCVVCVCGALPHPSEFFLPLTTLLVPDHTLTYTDMREMLFKHFKVFKEFQATPFNEKWSHINYTDKYLKQFKKRLAVHFLMQIK